MACYSSDFVLILHTGVKIMDDYSEIIGTSVSILKVLKLVSQVAKTQSTVLLLGETGTGKEVVAKAIHQNSLRKDEALVTINCAALPVNLIESELFGHEKGSYTGAAEQRIGKWELAHQGTLFLDEIGEMPLDLQVKLLRALQEREIERIGGRTVIKTDVRVIAATNKDLQNEIRQGNFRSDLFFRLNVFPITIPPLRERKQDIAALAIHFLDKYVKKTGRKISGISGKAIRKLSGYNWPGNVRELENLIERSVLLASQPIIHELPLPVGDENMESALDSTRIKTMDEVQREHIIHVLKFCKGKIAGPGGAADALKMPPTTLHSMIKRLGIRKTYLE
jgi:transcriptional regulator with GAF, ATPase, and Fis domain